MSNFHFKRLEKYKVSGTAERMELSIPLPKTPSGKVYRWCPNDKCTPRLFLLGNTQRIENIDLTKFRRTPGTQGTTCPYCGTDADDSKFNYEGDIEAIINYIAWAYKKDVGDLLNSKIKEFNRSQSGRGLISIKMEVKSDNSPEPRVWREDLIRNLACDVCGCNYGVYAIALFCPDCGSKNLHVHFEREIELVLQQIDLADQIAENDEAELSYRILGNAHEDVLTAFETYQKTCYIYMIRKTLPEEEAEKLLNKGSIGNRFQNIEKAIKLYNNLSINPFFSLTSDELHKLKIYIEKRHVIGHNLSIADETYYDIAEDKKPGTTINIIGNEISDFAQITKKVILDLERLL